jgi:UDPglucose 6-dehydrogenase
MGKLGACSAACFAAKGFEVIGVDINKDVVDAINNGKAPVYEPRLQEFIARAQGRLKATQEYAEAVRNSDVTFLIVPTPSRPDGHFSDKYLQDALKHLAAAFRDVPKKYHLFVITSTVSPGTTGECLIPLIESVSGKKLNRDFGVCFHPEFIALGSVITDFLNPDLVLIGESDKTAGDHLVGIYEKVCENKPYIARMSIISAEITKLSLNSYITMKISFANTLANLCEAIPGAHIDDITKALGADRRISPYYLKGGLSFGGPCFPRDNRAFIAFAKKYGIDANLVKATDEVNRFQVDHLVNKIVGYMAEGPNNVVAVLGLAFKPNTHVIEESPGVKIIEELLKKKDVKIIVYDPLAMENARGRFGDNILYASSLKDCLSNSSLCVITTQAEEFKMIREGDIRHHPTTIIDCWRSLDPSRLGPHVRYEAIGTAGNKSRGVKRPGIGR